MWICPGGLQTFLFWASFCLAFIDARRDVAGCSRGMAGEKKKLHKRKGMKVLLNMHFNGWANSSQIGRASRREFDAALVDSQAGEAMWRDEKRDEGVRKRADTDSWGEVKGAREQSVGHVTSTSHFTLSCFFLTVYLTPFFSLLKFPPLWLQQSPSFSPHLQPSLP